MCDFKQGDKVTYQKTKRERGKAVVSRASTAPGNRVYIVTETEGTLLVSASELEKI